MTPIETPNKNCLRDEVIDFVLAVSEHSNYLGMVNNRGSTVVMGCLRLCIPFLLLLVWTFPRVIHEIAILFHPVEIPLVFGRNERKQTCKPAKLMHGFPAVRLLRLAESTSKFRRFKNVNLQSSCIIISSDKSQVVQTCGGKASAAFATARPSVSQTSPGAGSTDGTSDTARIDTTGYSRIDCTAHRSAP